MPYYYADGLYYSWNNDVDEYEAVDPPSGLSQTPPANYTASMSAPQVSTTLYAYPKGGQSEAQQAQDRAECAKWASSQTGFDPTKQTDADQKSAAVSVQGYLRAEAACLEARNYSVK